jgi:hypothetical protein
VFFGEMFNFIGENDAFYGEIVIIRRVARSKTRQNGDGVSDANFAI